MNKNFFSVLISLTLLFSVSCKSKKKVEQSSLANTVVIQQQKVFEAFPQSPKERPKNVILLIGDGMGLAQIHAAFLTHQDKLNMQSAQYAGFIDTRSSNSIITDSGAGGTALACGVKTYNGAIGVDTDTLPVKTILEKCSEIGMSTGIAVSCALTHATPASFFAHRQSRNMDSAIAQDFYGKNITVAFGGGMQFFDSARLVREGYSFLRGTNNIMQSKSDKIVGFYNADKHPPSTIKGRGDWLPDVTLKSLEILSKNDKGFFLMVEGSQIDWGGHGNDIDFIVKETLDFDKVLGRVLEFAAADGNTLVIVTADHETGGLTLLTDSGSKNLVPKFSTDNHTAIYVPILSWGPGASFFTGFMDNTDVPKRIEQLLGIK
jgi:alkaline phosphatase